MKFKHFFWNRDGVVPYGTATCAPEGDVGMIGVALGFVDELYETELDVFVSTYRTSNCKFWEGKGVFLPDSPFSSNDF